MAQLRFHDRFSQLRWSGARLAESGLADGSNRTRQFVRPSTRSPTHPPPPVRCMHHAPHTTSSSSLYLHANWRCCLLQGSLMFSCYPIQAQALSRLDVSPFLTPTDKDQDKHKLASGPGGRWRGGCNATGAHRMHARARISLTTGTMHHRASMLLLDKSKRTSYPLRNASLSPPTRTQANAKRIDGTDSLKLVSLQKDREGTHR